MITFTDRNQKGTVRHENCTVAKAAIVDPEVTKSMPPQLTVSTGVDALCHAAESLTIRNNPNPISTALAKESITLIAKYLPIAHRDGGNMEAREKMGYAALMAGQALSTTLVHLAHAFGHSLGVVLHKPHGLMVGQALPVVMNYLADTDCEMVRVVGECMGVVLPEYASPKAVGTAVGEALYAFYEEIEFPSLPELGVTLEQALEAAPLVSTDGYYTYAAKQPNDEEIVAFITKMYHRTL